MSLVVDLDTIDQLKEFMEDGFSNLVDTYIRSSDQYVINIVKGYSEGDVQKIIDAAHPLKSSSGNLGLQRLSVLADSIEMVGKTVASGEKPLDILAGDIAKIGALYITSKAALKEQV